MTVLAAATPRRHSTSLLVPLTAVVIGAAGILLAIGQAHVRLFEAGLSAGIIRLIHLGQAHAVGSSVIFPRDQHWIGFTITASCTAALLISPFWLIGSGLLLTRRIQVRTAFMAVVSATLIVWFANQLRLLVIGASMRVWGFRQGYSRSHVLAGGVVSTLGVAIGIAAFVALMLHDRPGRQTGPGRRPAQAGRVSSPHTGPADRSDPAPPEPDRH